MIDQATELRRLVWQSLRGHAVHAGPPPRSIALASGARGAGVTTLAVNLAVTAAESGLRVVLVDADERSQGIERACGMTPLPRGADAAPGRDIHEALRLGPNGVQVLSRAWERLSGRVIDDATQERLLRQLATLGRHADLVIVDLGAAATPLLRRFAAAADDTLQVVTPHSDQITACYTQFKFAVADFPAVVVRLVINQVQDESAAREVFTRINDSCQKFLEREMTWLGWVPTDAQVAEAALAETPVCLLDRAAPASRAIQSVLETLLNEPQRRGRERRAS